MLRRPSLFFPPHLLLSPENCMRGPGRRLGPQNAILGAQSRLDLTQTARRANLTFVPRSPENRMRFSGDKSKLHAIGSLPNGFARACLRRAFFPEPFLARFSHGIFDSGEKSRRKTRVKEIRDRAPRHSGGAGKKIWTFGFAINGS